VIVPVAVIVLGEVGKTVLKLTDPSLTPPIPETTLSVASVFAVDLVHPVGAAA
jgi:hypothetical protein